MIKDWINFKQKYPKFSATSSLDANAKNSDLQKNTLIQKNIASLKKVFLSALSLLFILILASCSGGQSVEMDVQGQGNQSQNNDGNAQSLPELQNEILSLNGVPDEGNETPPPVMSHGEDYERSRSLNSEVVGWLSVPNTNIEYPVARCDDNEYYLTHNAEREKSKSGAVFMDFRNTNPESDKHILVYGHNMRNGSMFHDLNSYKVKDFFENNRDIILYLGDDEVKFEIYAAFVVSADVNFMEIKFTSNEIFLNYMNALKDMSKFTAKPAVTLLQNDQILTLITCTYEYDDSRFAVQARRVS